jgi:hypothetical protein
MRYFNTSIVVGLLLLAAACKSSEVRSEVPAYLVDPTTESRAELQHVVSSMLGGKAVTIADDALTTQSMLIIGAKYLTGRDLGKPEQFQLLRIGSTCVLVHLGSGTRSELSEANCAAE